MIKKVSLFILLVLLTGCGAQHKSLYISNTMGLDGGLDDQKDPAVIVNAYNQPIVVWESDADSDGKAVYVRRYDENANTSSLKVNTTTKEDQNNPDIAYITTGKYQNGYVIVWESKQNGDDDIYCRLFDSNDYPALGNEFLINSTIDDGLGDGDPKITSLTNGNIAIVWEREEELDGDKDIYCKIIDQNKNVIKNQFRVNTYNSKNQKDPEIIAVDDGFIIVWESKKQSGDSSYGIFAKKLSNNGIEMTTDTHINTFTSNRQAWVTGTKLSNGNVIFSWINGDNKDIIDGAPANDTFYLTDIRARVFSPALSPVNSEVIINDYSSLNIFYPKEDQNKPSITGLNDGCFVVTWDLPENNTDLSGVFAKEFTGSCNPRYMTPVKMNTILNGDQIDPDVAVCPNGNLVFVWESYSLEINNRKDIFRKEVYIPLTDPKNND